MLQTNSWEIVANQEGDEETFIAYALGLHNS